MVREEIYEPYDGSDHPQMLEPTNWNNNGCIVLNASKSLAANSIYIRDRIEEGVTEGLVTE